MLTHTKTSKKVTAERAFTPAKAHLGSKSLRRTAGQISGLQRYARLLAAHIGAITREFFETTRTFRFRASCLPSSSYA